MIKKIITYIFTSFFCFSVIFANNNHIAIHKSNSNDDKDKVLIEALRVILENGHYEPKMIDDKFSEAIFTSFIEDLDPYKRYFLASDITYFKQYYHDIDNQILRRKLDFFNLVTETLNKRVLESQVICSDILKENFNYNTKETFSLNPEKVSYPIDKNDQKNVWAKFLKFSTLTKINDYIKEEQTKVNNKENYTPKPIKEIEKIVIEKTKKNIEDLFYFEKQNTKEEQFAIFLNSITTQFDPHTNYFAPETKKQFDSNISGSIEGIGARLQDERGYTKIVELISGGPAYKQGELEVGDYIIKVAQDKQESKEIVGMKLSDAIQLIKGPKGTTVTLTIKKADNSIKQISIVRDIVEFEETFVKSAITTIDGKKYGIIDLPKFYIDFNENNNRNAATDMEKEIKILKSENVEGIIIDLRNNGGGSLSTAIDISGFFIEKGPVVQVKYKNMAPLVKKDEDKTILWDKPLVILINELSASASEILAAAMQDYKRAIIIGSKQSYGKGTVQNVIPINQYLKYPEDLGAVKLTIQKFYRINGGSTQLLGVSSDIVMPDRFTYLDVSERDQKTALKWDIIENAKYKVTETYRNYDEVIKSSQERIHKNSQFKSIDEYAKWLKENQDNATFSLNLKKFQEEEKANHEQSEKFKDVFTFQSKYTFNSTADEKTLTDSDEILKDKRFVWHDKLSKDIYIHEALETLKLLELAK